MTNLNKRCQLSDVVMRYEKIFQYLWIWEEENFSSDTFKVVHCESDTHSDADAFSHFSS